MSSPRFNKGMYPQPHKPAYLIDFFSETPYWQGPGNDLAPAPWTNNLIASDPDFSNCAAGDETCRMAFFEKINGSSDLFLYNGMIWAFFNNGVACKIENNCQKNAVDISNSSSLYIYGQNVNYVTNIFLEDSVVVATTRDNSGGWGGVVAAYLRDT